MKLKGAVFHETEGKGKLQGCPSMQHLPISSLQILSPGLITNYRHYIKKDGLGRDVHSGSLKAFGSPRAYGIESLERCFNSVNATLSVKPALIP